ncbi:hypothetical protein KH400_00480 [Desertibacillus haloalkaliphilus]|nr:hypothetical protein [Desertibacillus haloalkaliphilus]
MSPRRRYPIWLRRARDVLYQFTFPLLIFQLIRTIFFPSTFDVFLLILLAALYISFLLGLA